MNETGNPVLTPGTRSPDGYYVWTGESWLPATSPVPNHPPPQVHSSAPARAVQLLLAAWISAALLELFVVDLFFSIEFTPASGRSIPFRWGAASAVISAGLVIATLAWLVPNRGRIVSALKRSQPVRILLGAWALLFTAYVLTDVVLAEVVRGVPIDGPETRWQVLLSAVFGVGAATIGLVTVNALEARSGSGGRSG